MDEVNDTKGKNREDSGDEPCRDGRPPPSASRSEASLSPILNSRARSSLRIQKPIDALRQLRVHLIGDKHDVRQHGAEVDLG